MVLATKLSLLPALALKRAARAAGTFAAIRGILPLLTPLLCATRDWSKRGPCHGRSANPPTASRSRLQSRTKILHQRSVSFAIRDHQECNGSPANCRICCTRTLVPHTPPAARRHLSVNSSGVMWGWQGEYLPCIKFLCVCVCVCVCVCASVCVCVCVCVYVS